MPYAETITNHTRITITSKKTGKEVVILETNPAKADYTNTERGQFVLAGIPSIEAIDDSLDSLVFTIRESKTRELFKPFDVVTYTVDDGIAPKSYEMCIASDHATLLSRAFGFYDHTIMCIEETKILEKVKIFNLNLTNPHDTLEQQFDKALTNAEPVIMGTGAQRPQRFAMSERLRAFLKDKPGEDFYNGNTDLRTVLDNILSKLNARVCADHIEFEGENISRIVLGYRSMTATKDITPVWSFEEQGEIVGEEFENSVHDVAGTIYARGVNTLSDEPITFTDTFKADAQSLNDENARAFLPFPLSEKGIEHFYIKARFSITYKVKFAFASQDNTFKKDLTVDIAKYIIPSEQYEVLPGEKKENNLDQKHHVPFQVGATSIGAGIFREGIFNWSKSKLNEIMMRCAEEQHDLTAFSKEDFDRRCETEIMGSMSDVHASGVDKSSYDYAFTITYYPLADTAAAHAKPNVYDKDELLLGITDSQSENTLNMERHGRRLKSLIKRTGNDEYYLDVQAKYYSKLLPLMAKINLPTDNAGHTDDDYVVYKREIAVYYGHVKCRYYFSKDYNAVQEYAGIQREKHIFDIPLESEECPLIVRKFVVFGFEKGDAEQQYFSDFVGSALRTLTGENEGRTYITYQETVDNTVNNYMSVSTGKVNFLLLSTVNRHANGSEEVLPSPGKVFLLPALTYGQGNTMNFIARPLDNYSVNYSRDGYTFSIWGDAGHLITYNRYVSDEAATAGECARFRLSYAFEYGVLENPAIFSNYEDILKKFPVVDDNYFATCMNGVTEIIYNKDRTQRPLFCSVMECVPTAVDYGDLIIGSAFCRDNNLVHENGEGLHGLKLVVSRTTTIDDDDEWISDGFTGNYSVRDYFVVYGESGEAAARLEYKGGLGDGITAWAIVNECGEIYLAANGAPRTVYAWIMDFPE